MGRSIEYLILAVGLTVAGLVFSPGTPQAQTGKCGSICTSKCSKNAGKGMNECMDRCQSNCRAKASKH